VSKFRTKLKSSQAVFLYVAMVYLLAMVHNQTDLVGGGESIRRKELNFILILCGGSGKQSSKQTSIVSRKIRQVEVMLKSAVLFTKKKLHFHVIVDRKKSFGRLINSTASWPDRFRRKLKFSIHDVRYPKDMQHRDPKVKVCAMETLFLPDMFPYLDKAIFIDTDIIFMRPPEVLWAVFDDFSSSHIAAMAPNINQNGPKRNHLPYYRENRLNVGIMHIHLDRMREFSDGWTRATMAVYDKFKRRIRMADQAILNILFSFYPEKLYKLPCEWNYRPSLCSQGIATCPGVVENGVSLLRGDALSSEKGKEMQIYTMFEAFEHFELGVHSLRQLYTQVASQMAKVTTDSLASACSEVEGIDYILLGELERQVNRIEEHEQTVGKVKQ